MSLLPKQIIPETEPIGTVSGTEVRITHNWYLLLYNISAHVLGGGAAPPVPAALAVPVTASPFKYIAPANGDLAIIGGLVSKISLTRASITVQVGVTMQLFPVRRGDTVTVSYVSAPAVTFFPD